MLRFDVGEDLLHYYCNVDRVAVYATPPVNVAIGAKILRQIGAGRGQEPLAGSIVLPEEAYRAAIGGTVAVPCTDMPPIAVLPLQSMSADGIVEDIITGLSRILRVFEPRWRTRCAGLNYPKDDRDPPSRCDPRRRSWADCLFWVEAV